MFTPPKELLLYHSLTLSAHVVTLSFTVVYVVLTLSLKPPTISVPKSLKCSTMPLPSSPFENHSTTSPAHFVTTSFSPVNSSIPFFRPAIMSPPISSNTVDGEWIPNRFLTQVIRSRNTCSFGGRTIPLMSPPMMSPPILSPSVLLSPSIPRAFLIADQMVLPILLNFSLIALPMPPKILVAIVPHTTPLNIFLKVHFAANTLNTVEAILSQSTSAIISPTPCKSVCQSVSSMILSMTSQIPLTSLFAVSPHSLAFSANS